MRFPTKALGLIFICGLPGLVTPGCTPRRNDSPRHLARPVTHPAHVAASPAAHPRRGPASRHRRTITPSSLSRGKIAATLNGRAILLVDVTRLIPDATRKRIRAIPGLGPSSWALRQAQLLALKKLIEAQLLFAEATRQRHMAHDADVKRAIAAVLRQGGITQTQLVASLKVRGLTLAQYRTELAQRLSIIRLLAMEQSKHRFTNAALKARYQAQRPNGAPFQHSKARLRREITRQRLLHRLRQRAQITIRLKRLSRPQPKPSARLLSVSPLLNAEDIFRLLRNSGPFQVGRLPIPPRSTTHDSFHFKAIGKIQSYDLAYRVWILKEPALTQRFSALRKTLPRVRTVNRVANRSLRSSSPQVRGHAFLSRKASAVVLITCGTKLCPTDTMLLRVTRLLYKKLLTWVRNGK